MTTELELANGLWIPAGDLKISTYNTYKGLPNLDVSKVNETIAYCTSFNRALDVGAHVGATSLLMSRRFSEVVAFEPIPQNYLALLRNIEGSLNIIAENCAVSNECSELTFEHVPTHTQVSRVIKAGESRAFMHSLLIGPIPARPIDSFEYSQVSFIKIDVEGFELAVVEGARETILRCRPSILLEQRGNEGKFHGDIVHGASMFLEGLGMTSVEGLSFRNDRLYRFA